jgi:uncharacterized protein YjbI with pentapeptide repeats
MNTDREHSEQQTKQSRWGFRGMTVRDWLQLLIVPLALLGIGFLFSVQQDARQQTIEDQRAKAERELAKQRAQGEALQAYLSQRSQLILEEHLRNSDADSELRTLARARTLTMLESVDPDRKTEVMRFLVEAVLIQSVGGKNPIIELSSADLHNIDLRPSGAELNATNPLDIASGLEEFDGHRTVLIGIDLHGAALDGVDMKGAALPGANLREASLHYTDLRPADLRRADLSRADLEGANLSNADLKLASLDEADLTNADLTGAMGVTSKYLEQVAGSLDGATMPNGQKYLD